MLLCRDLFCVVYGFSNASTHPWGTLSTWGFLAAGAVALLAFFLWQARAKHPLLPLRVLADRNRGAALSAVLISSAGMFGVFLFLTYLQGTLNYSPVMSGVAFLPMVGTLMVTAQLSTNWLVPRLGPKLIVPIGMLVTAAGMVWLTRLGLHSGYAAHVLPPLLLLIGAGIGLSMPAAMSRATLGVRMTDQGVASATANTTQQVGGSISTALLNTLVASAAVHYAQSHLTNPLVQADAALHSYATAYWWSAGFFAFGAIVTVLLFRRQGRGPARGGRPRPGAAGARHERLRVPVAEIPCPAAQEQVEFLHDLLDRYQQPGPGRDSPDPIPSVLNSPTCGPAGQEDQMCRPGSPPTHQPIVEAHEVQPLSSFDQVHDAGLGSLGFQPKLAQQDRQGRQRGFGLLP